MVYYNFFTFTFSLSESTGWDIDSQFKENSIYHCHICSYVTLSSAHIKRHLLTHSENKPYECYVCHKTFRQKVHLKTHLHTHSGKRPYSCQDCGRSFLTKQNCQTHVCQGRKK